MYIEKWSLVAVGIIILMLAYKLYDSRRTLKTNFLAAEGEVIRLCSTSGMYRANLRELQRYVNERIFLKNGLMQYEEAISFSPLYGDTERNQFLWGKLLSEKELADVERACERLYSHPNTISYHPATRWQDPSFLET